MIATQFDYIIVGGGVAGCVLANRLSARAGCAVLLLEAGPDLLPGAEPADVLDVYPYSYFNPAYKWQSIRGHWRTRGSSPAAFIEQGRILGGSSAIMGMIALRGVPDDYDGWAQAGAAGWSWNDVLPYFRDLENDLDFDGPLHGNAGPTAIRRHRTEEWPPLACAAHAFAQRNAIAHIADANADFRDGYVSMPIAASHTARSFSATSYLDRAVRTRPNLTVLADATVREILFEGSRASGVKASVGGAERTFHGKEIIITAGALQSPVLLLQAGIGPAAMLREAGVAARQDVPGVGRNLQNHPALFVAAHLRKGAEQSAALRNHNNTGFRYSSGLPQCPPADMFMTVLNRSAWHPLGHRVAGFSTILNKPASRGVISLAPGNAQQAVIEFNFLDDPLDLERMTAGFRRCVDFVYSDEIQSVVQRVFPVSRTDRLRTLNARNRANAIKTHAVAKVLDLVPAAGDAVFRQLISGQKRLDLITADPDTLRAHVLANVSGLAHNVGTCRMGAANDPMAVVDNAGKVHKVGGLRVADASIMPDVPRGNTNLPTLMVAEKVAAAILAGH